mgnify:CR=1 FL=1
MSLRLTNHDTRNYATYCPLVYLLVQGGATRLCLSRSRQITWNIHTTHQETLFKTYFQTFLSFHLTLVCPSQHKKLGEVITISR